MLIFSNKIEIIEIIDIIQLRLVLVTVLGGQQETQPDILPLLQIFSKKKSPGTSHSPLIGIVRA